MIIMLKWILLILYRKIIMLNRGLEETPVPDYKSPISRPKATLDSLSTGKFMLLVTLISLETLFLANLIYHKLNNKHFPNTSKVQSGYVVPNKLEIKLEDIDDSGEVETIMEYDGKNYLLYVDEQGRPKIQSYEIKSAEIISKDY